MIVQHVVAMMHQDAAVSGILADRTYPMSWPDAPEFPLSIVQKATGIPEADMAGPAGVEVARIQVDVYDYGYAAVVAAAKAIKSLLHGISGGPTGAPCVITASFCINDADQPVPETERAGPRLRRRMLEFRIWFKEAL